MAEQPQTIRSIDFKSVFPFTLIFRSFRSAVHPSKLILALLALLLIYVGGSILDTIWPGRGAVPDEIVMYADAREQRSPSEVFTKARDDAWKLSDDAYKAALAAAGKPDGGLGDIKAYVVKTRDEAVDRARKGYDEAKKAAEDAYTAANKDGDKAVAEAKRRDESIKRAAENRDDSVKRAYKSAHENYATARKLRGEGLFDQFIAYQVGQLNQTVAAVRDLRFTGQGGAIQRSIDFFTVAPAWALRYHPIYFIAFFALFLSVWSVFGGAISRIAAVHIARDEKISIRQALRFSTGKFFSFLSAPIIPLLIIVGVGALVAAGGFLLNIGFVGPIAVGGLFVLALVAGFVMTLVVLGLGGGFNLMYPTIAVEGSDSFDAISRSFSYLYARPWRLGFYTIIAAVYGSITYAFVRYFVELMLLLTHFFGGLFVFTRGNNGEPLWPMLWPGPVITQRLSYTPEYLTLGLGESWGAFFIWFWIHLLGLLIGAFAVSFYFVASTVIYYLMRKEVDATELDDVYLEQSEEDFVDTVPAATPGDAAPTPPPAG